MESKHIVLSRLLPKTGQTVHFVDGDDGDLEKGWWKGRLNATNRTRFVAKTISGDDVVIDRATGLMWAANGSEAGCFDGDILVFEEAVLQCEGLTFAGFTDWRLPNIKELISIVDFSKWNPSIDGAFFTRTVLADYWSSTTKGHITSKAWYVSFMSGITTVTMKGMYKYLRCVRSL